MNWINIKDRKPTPPESEDKLIICLENGNRLIDWFYYDRNKFVYEDTYASGFNPVIAWMVLPKPPLFVS